MRRECSTNVETRNTYRILVGKPEGKRPLGRSRQVNDIKMVWYAVDLSDSEYVAVEGS
jgi:hypothetical protein